MYNYIKSLVCVCVCVGRGFCLHLLKRYFSTPAGTLQELFFSTNTNTNYRVGHSIMTVIFYG